MSNRLIIVNEKRLTDVSVWWTCWSVSSLSLQVRSNSRNALCIVPYHSILLCLFTVPKHPALTTKPFSRRQNNIINRLFLPKPTEAHKNNFLQYVDYEGGESRIVVIALSSSYAYACFCFPYNNTNSIRKATTRFSIISLSHHFETLLTRH